MHHEIANRHFARRDERRRAGEQAQRDENARDQLYHPRRKQHRRQRVNGKRHRKSEEFGGRMFKEQQPGHNPKQGEQLRLPARKPG